MHRAGITDRRHVVAVVHGHRHELTLLVDDPDATVGDVVDAIHRATVGSVPAAAIPSGGGIGTVDPSAFGVAPGATIDGRWVPSQLAVRAAGLLDGCEVVVGTAPAVSGSEVDAAWPHDGTILAVTEGPAAGSVWPLDDAPLTIGRSSQVDVVLDDPTVSAHHAAIVPCAGAHAGVGSSAWTVRDLGSRNGTWIDDQPVVGDAPLRPGQVLRLGASHLRVGHLDDARHSPDPPSTSGTVVVNRPPRPALPAAPTPVALPTPPAPVAPARGLSVVSILAPLVLAGALVWWTGNPRFALFLLLSPVLAVGTWWSARHQARRRRRADARGFDRALASLRRDLDDLVDAEVARRRALLPDVAETVRCIRPPGRRLWERRDGHADHLRLRVGIGTVPWDPPVRSDASERHNGSAADDPDGSDAAAQAGAVAAEVDRASRLPRCPVEVDLGAGRVVGIVGDRAAARALARSLVIQAAVHHGPADLAVAAFARDASAGWAWVTWLPHARWRQTGVPIVVGAPPCEEVLDEWRAQAATTSTPDRTLLVLVDDARLVHGRRSSLRTALAGDAGCVAGIVLADRIDELPAVTSTVITLHGPCGDGELHRPGDGSHVDDLVIGGLGHDVAQRWARGMARFDDPELDGPTAGIPALVRLAALLGVGDDTADAADAADAVRRRWAAQPVDPAPATPIGIGAHGVVEVDLVADGPHGLLVGTTGSGKSELLRSLVVGLASRVDPDHLTFVLIDYKGGSAFDGCAALPHTVGVVTDLDEHLGARALRSLDAEVRHRERILREAGVADLPAYLRAGATHGALPRLVVVVDEFATLAAELPELLAALVGLAQRGRSLGIHLLLATQRPGGALNASITANTDLRIALRVQAATDAIEVIGQADAASVPRSLPGRGYLRTARAGTIAVQTAWASAATPAQRWPVRAVPFGPAVTSTSGDATAGEAGVDDDVAVSDLDRLVTAIGAAAVRCGVDLPRQPWVPPLPEVIDHHDIAAVLGRPLEASPGVVIGVADDPDRQRRVAATWQPADGHLAVFGMVGSGTTTALRGLACALAARFGADACHLHAVEMAPGGLDEVVQLPITGTYAGPADAELRLRLVRHLRRELDRRRGLTPAQLACEPWTVVLIDGIGALLADLDAPEVAPSSDALRRVLAEGPTVRIVVAMAGARVGELPLRDAMSVGRRLLLRHADVQELTGCGLRSNQLPTFVPGRAVEADGTVVQLARPASIGTGGVSPVAPAGHGAARGPVRLRPLPHHLDVASLPAGHVEAGGMRLPIGVAEEDLAPLTLALPPSGHAIVAGPPRSGVTSTLAVIAAQARAADEHAVLIGICAPGSPLYDSGVLDAAGSLEDLVDVVAAASTDARRWVVLVDGAPRVVDVGSVVAGLVAGGRPAIHVVAGGRADELRGAFAHWTRELRTSRCGVLLRPDLAVDGEVIGGGLPRRVPVALDPPGRGFVVTDGVAALAQLAAPMVVPPARGAGRASHGAPLAARAS